MSEIDREKYKDLHTAQQWKTFEEMFNDLEILLSNIQTCKSGHKYLAHSPEYPCPYCQIAKFEDKCSHCGLAISHGRMTGNNIISTCPALNKGTL